MKFARSGAAVRDRRRPDFARVSKSLLSGVYVDAEFEAGVADLILKSEADELGLVVAESTSEVSGSFKTYSTAAVLDVAEVRA